MLDLMNTVLSQIIHNSMMEAEVKELLLHPHSTRPLSNL
jgi:hypothetical protein